MVRRVPVRRGKPVRVLDVACGGGDVALSLKRLADRAGFPVKVTGCDLSPVAVEFAQQTAKSLGLEVEFFEHDALIGEIPGTFDLVTSSLFLHHLGEEEAVAFLGMCAGAGPRTFHQDLLRTPLGYALAKMTVPFITRSRVVRVDGVRSVEGAFSLPEVRDLVDRAGLQDAEISRCWPERFSLYWTR
jgi:2-polyprenyl-3-methyl-5-hydroxy-6-metoxy-1,4-benzoquinol methylase